MDRACDLPLLSLQPGELYLARNPALLQTILGSCVGITFWSARLGAGAMLHGVLPREKSDDCSDLADRQRYVDFSIRYLARQFDGLGVRRKDLEVKVFGGADVLPVMANRSAIPTVGALNCRAALEVLEEEGFRVLASDLRGVRGRRIHFHTGTGEVLVHKLGSWDRRDPAHDKEKVAFWR